MLYQKRDNLKTIIGVPIKYNIIRNTATQQIVRTVTFLKVLSSHRLNIL